MQRLLDTPRPPTVHQVTGWLARHTTALNPGDQTGLKEVLAHCPELDKATGHVRDIGEILTDRLGSALPNWIDAVDASQLPGLTGFPLRLLRDLDALTAGLTLDWSAGSIEGAVNRIKKIKRQLYRRAGFELLRKMIPHPQGRTRNHSSRAAASPPEPVTRPLNKPAAPRTSHLRLRPLPASGR
ncbi:hypothetical protein GTY65_27435 [Streptomyces sp. SID8379]|uniref:hypothetical protein n=1 Tax=unclassified Streptomyces TaxID=2593676 RepID=UPI001319BFD2|nr:MULTISPECIES: hypothetical protein [unclassified Streptomyces]MYW67778.1 hypothetical protein [Streptomyces sp. SID8379]